MINNVTLVGRLTKDPELRYTPSGDAVCNFTLAVNRTFKNAQGETDADFIMCQVWRKQGENAATYLKKGSLAGVTGSIRTRNYEQDGKRVYVTEIHCDSVQFLDPAGSRDNQSGGQGNYQQQNNQQQSQGNYGNNNQGNYQPNNQGQYGSGNQGNYQQQGQGNYNNNNQGNYQGNGGGYNQQQRDPFANQGNTIDISDDDLPF